MTKSHSSSTTFHYPKTKSGSHPVEIGGSAVCNLAYRVKSSNSTFSIINNVKCPRTTLAKLWPLQKQIQTDQQLGVT